MLPGSVIDSLLHTKVAQHSQATVPCIEDHLIDKQTLVAQEDDVDNLHLADRCHL